MQHMCTSREKEQLVCVCLCVLPRDVNQRASACRCHQILEACCWFGEDLGCQVCLYEAQSRDEGKMLVLSPARLAASTMLG
jgi:hypothetical protein